VIFRSRTLPRVWDRFNELPEEIQRRAEKQYSLFAGNPFRPSLHFKPVGNFWSVRVPGGYRAVAVREGNDFVGIWIGSHDEYELRISR
jgi:hypothetical protein